MTDNAATLWQVSAEDSMGGRIVLFRATTKADALSAKSSYSKDSAYTQLRIEEVVPPAPASPRRRSSKKSRRIP